MRNKSNVEKIKSIKPKKRKNVSQKYRNGLILQESLKNLSKLKFGRVLGNLV